MKLIDVYPDDSPDPTPAPNPSRRPPRAWAATSSSCAARRCAASSATASRSPSRSSPASRRGRVHAARRLPHVPARPPHHGPGAEHWFPLVDRNPQTFVEHPRREAGGLQAATQRVYRSAGPALRPARAGPAVDRPPPPVSEAARRRIVWLLVGLAAAGLVMVLAIGGLAASGAWKPLTWMPWHRSQLARCRQQAIERGATEVQAKSYCACLLAYGRAAAGASSEYRVQMKRRTARRWTTTERTTAAPPADAASPPADRPPRKSGGAGPGPPGTATEVERCAGRGWKEGGTEARLTAYCECLHLVIEPRWSLRRLPQPARRRLAHADGAKEPPDAAGRLPNPPRPRLVEIGRALLDSCTERRIQ